MWETMKKKNIRQYYLLKHGIDNKTLDGIKKSKNITLLTLERLFELIECTPNDIIRFIYVYEVQLEAFRSGNKYLQMEAEYKSLLRTEESHIHKLEVIRYSLLH